MQKKILAGCLWPYASLETIAGGPTGISGSTHTTTDTGRVDLWPRSQLGALHLLWLSGECSCTIRKMYSTEVPPLFGTWIRQKRLSRVKDMVRRPPFVGALRASGPAGWASGVPTVGILPTELHALGAGSEEGLSPSRVAKHPRRARAPIDPVVPDESRGADEHQGVFDRAARSRRRRARVWPVCG